MRCARTTLTDRDKVVEVNEENTEERVPVKETEFMGFQIKALNKRKAEAKIGYMAMNLYSPPKAATWGVYNDRKISDMWVQSLVKSFKGVLEHNYEKNCIEIAIRPEWLKNRDAVLTSIDGLGIEEMPHMEFTEEGEAAMAPDKLIVVGGNHRRQALRIYVDWLEARIANEEKLLEKASEAAPSDAAVDLSQPTPRELLAVMKEEKEQSCYWAVRMYDIGVESYL